MKRLPIASTLACLLGGLLCATGASAQLYKSVGADGRILNDPASSRIGFPVGPSAGR